MQFSPNSFTKLNDKDYLYFSGTSYYSLHSNKKMINASINAIGRYGLGSAVSRTTYGKTPLLIEIEKKLSVFFDAECSVYLPSGYLSNMAGMKAIYKQHDYKVIFIDEGSHYSVFDGAKSMGMEIITFKHCNATDLELKLKLTKKKSLIATDGVFPLFGKIAPLNKYVDLLNKYNAILWVDDAHGVGVLGKTGKGTIEHFSIKHPLIYFGATLSKAFGGYGGFISGDKNFIDEVKRGEVVNGTNSMPASVIASSIMGIELLTNNLIFKDKLWSNAIFLKEKLKQIGINTNTSVFPIATWNNKPESEMLYIKDYLLKKNIAIQLLKYSGSENVALRIVVFSTHSKKQIELLVNELKNAISTYSS